MNVILTGFMGTGKTVIGKSLVAKLGEGWKYVDMDELIEEKSGMKITDIFSKHGESYFRVLETKIVKKVSEYDNSVIATGGGVVLRKENMDMLEKKGIIVNLKARPETVYERVKSNTDRPLLNKPDPMSEIVRLLSYREPFYKRCGLSIDTDELSVEKITGKIIEYMKQV